MAQSPVYTVGTVGDTTTLEVQKADSSNPLKMPAVGLLDADLAPNDPGHAIVVGELTGASTAGYGVNAPLYVAAGGGVTATRPTTGIIQQVAIVGRSHATTGSLTATIGPQLNPLWDTAYSERLQWNGGSTGLDPVAGRASLLLGSAAQASTGDFASATAPAAAVAMHEAESDPHPQYLTSAEGNAAYAPHTIADGLILVISNKGETVTASTNYLETLPLSYALTITKITFITNIDNPGTSTTTLSAYKRTAGGTKTTVLSANATLVSGASAVVASLSSTPGVLSVAAGERLGVDLIGLGTGASGIQAIFEFTRPAA
jgi:hypothetical protein